MPAGQYGKAGLKCPAIGGIQTVSCLYQPFLTDDHLLLKSDHLGSQIRENRIAGLDRVIVQDQNQQHDGTEAAEHDVEKRQREG